MNDPRRWLLLAVASLMLALLAPGSALAHADYERSVPDKDEVVAESPAQIEVLFTQELFKQEGRNFVRVFDDSATQVSDGDGIVSDDDRHLMTATLQPDLAPGRYIVQWMTTSDEDGDSAEGAFCFYVAVEPSPAQAEECAQLAGDDEESPTPPSADTPAPQGTEPAPTVGPTALPTADDTPDEGDGGLGAGVIVAIIVGVVALVVVGGGVAVWLRRTAA